MGKLPFYVGLCGEVKETFDKLPIRSDLFRARNSVSSGAIGFVYETERKISISAFAKQWFAWLSPRKDVDSFIRERR